MSQDTLDPATVEAEKAAALKETARLMGTLLIARRDVKAVEVSTANPTDWIWVPDKTKFTMGDFRSHLSGDRCLGTYLLDGDNKVKFVAFDVDLKTDCPYYVVEPIEKVNEREANGEYDADMDLMGRRGNLESALHDHTHEGYAWSRIRLMGVVRQLQDCVTAVLGLESLLIVTGGGAHVIVPFGSLEEAALARELGRNVMQAMSGWEAKNDNFWTPEVTKPFPPAGTFDPMTYTRYDVEIEVFPKQDIIKNEGGFGNLLRLPFGRHGATGIRTFALAEPKYSFQGMKLPKLHPLQAMRRLADSLGVE